MHCLWDGDLATYRVGFTTNDVDLGIAVWRLDDLIGRACQAAGATSTQVFLTSTDKSNFRYKLASDYKANRIQEKPVHYLALRQHMIDNMDAVVVEGMEADDAIGIAQSMAEPLTTCIISIDKDLDQIPGWHYNFVKEQLYNIGVLEAHRSFYWQVLVGDRTDNVEGCPGIGISKATRILDGCQSEIEMLNAVVKQYAKHHKDHWQERLLLAGNLLWLRRRPEQKWELSSGQVLRKDFLTSLIASDLSTNTNDTNSSSESPSKTEPILLTS